LLRNSLLDQQFSEPEQSFNKKHLAQKIGNQGRGKRSCREGSTRLLCNLCFTF